jgi:hypothetical protein
MAPMAEFDPSPTSPIEFAVMHKVSTDGVVDVREGIKAAKIAA